MPFVNEYISSEDVEKYQLAEVDAKFGHGSESRDWTIDRERDIYLRTLAVGREQEFLHRSYWTFYWKGTALTIRLDLLSGKGKVGQPGSAHWRLIGFEAGNGLPPHLMEHKPVILADLKQALTEYKDGGVFSVCTDFAVTLDIGEEYVE